MKKNLLLKSVFMFIIMVVINADLYAQPGWTYNITSGNHTILLQPGTITINGQAIASGDYIGVFYDQSGVLACGGYIEWAGTNTAVTAWGAEAGYDDGFQANEAFSWKIWRASDQQVFDATATYMAMPNQGTFAVNGISGLASLAATGSGPDPVVLSYTSVNVLCNGGATGSIDLTASGGVAPYTFIWSNSAISEDLNGLIADTYLVTVTDDVGTTANESITISQTANALGVTGVVSDATTTGGSDGSIDLSVTGGTAPYTYLWSNSSVSEDINGLIAGTYSVIVSDNNSCTASESFDVEEPQVATLSLSSTQVDVSCNGGNDGSIDLTATGGLTPYCYIWSDGSTTEDLSGLMAGTYTVTVSDDCGGTTPAVFDWTYNITSGNHTILLQPGTITIDGSPIASGDYVGVFYDQSGVLACGGYIEWAGTNTAVTAWGAEAGYDDGFQAGESFSWKVWRASDGAEIDMTATYMAMPNQGTFATNGISGIASLSGTSTGAQSGMTDAILTVTILEPISLTLSGQGVDVSCNGGSDGSIDLSVTGGTAPYTYLWSNGSVSEDLTALSSNDYSVTVSDVNGCSSTTLVSISEPTVISISGIVTDASTQGGSDGSIDLSVTGGTAPYTYLWSNSSVSEDINGLIAGTYSVIVSDNNSCTASESFDVEEPLVLPMDVTYSSTDITCFAGSDGSIDLSVTGGLTPYCYIWSDGSTTEDLNGLMAGTYTVTVTDDCGGTTPAVFDWTYNITSGNHTILLQPGTITIDGSPIASGDYIGVFYDQAGVLACGGYVEWAGTNTAVTAWGAEAGYDDGFQAGETFVWKVWRAFDGVEIDMTATYMAMPNQGTYATNGISGVATLSGISTNNLSGLNEIILSITLNEPNEIIESFDITICDNESYFAGGANQTTSGTYTDVYVALNGCDSTIITNLTVNPTYTSTMDVAICDGESYFAAGADQFVSGTFTDVYMTVDGCDSTIITNLTVNQLPVLTFVISDVTSQGGNDGAIDLSVSGNAPFAYLWSDNSISEDLSNLLAGTYDITVTDNNGCSTISNATVADGTGGPGWNVTTYTNTTTAYGIVTIDDLPVDTISPDYVGAFVGSECRGFSSVFNYNGSSYVTIEINGEVVETVEFKIWDASENTTLDVLFTTLSNPGGFLGLPPNYLPIAAYTSVTQTISFTNTGWNLISLNVTPFTPAPVDVFGSILNDVTLVKDLFTSYNPLLPPMFNTLTQLVDGSGYFVNVNNIGLSIDVTGMPVDVQNLEIPLIAGWNLIGYPCQVAQDVGIAISNLGSNVVLVKNLFESYNPALPPMFNTLTNMQPGIGYFIQVVNPDTLVFPIPSKSGGLENELTLQDNYWKTVTYPNSSVIYGKVTLDNNSINKGNIIGAFVNGECRGTGRVSDFMSESVISIVVNSEISESVEFKLLNDGKIYDSEFILKSEPGNMYGNESLLPITFRSITSSISLYSYPNPFEKETNINFNISESGIVQLAIYNIEGQLVKMVLNEWVEEGDYTFIWNGTNDIGKVCSSGVYYLQLINHEFNEVRKIVISK